jgi:hypothetical protein
MNNLQTSSMINMVAQQVCTRGSTRGFTTLLAPAAPVISGRYGELTYLNKKSWASWRNFATLVASSTCALNMSIAL